MTERKIPKVDFAKLKTPIDLIKALRNLPIPDEFMRSSPTTRSNTERTRIKTN